MSDAKTEVRDLVADEYHAETDYLSASMIKTFIGSRREFRSIYVAKESQKESRSLNIGHVAHSLILEPHLIGEKVVEIPDFVLSKSGAKSGNNWKEFRDEHKGCILLKAGEMQIVRDMFNAVYGNPKAAKMLNAKGHTEHSIFGELNGQKYRARLDRIIPRKLVIDIKTTMDASPEAFERQIRNLSYHVQGNLYKRLADAHYGGSHSVVFIAVSNSAPHCVATYVLSADHMYEAEQTTIRTVEQIQECYETNDWREIWEKELIELTPPRWWNPNSTVEAE